MFINTIIVSWKKIFITDHVMPMDESKSIVLQRTGAEQATIPKVTNKEVQRLA